MRIEVKPILHRGQIKSFCAFGPKYEVGEILRQMEDGDWAVKVKLIETGEESEYRYSHLESDPEAH